MLDRPSGEERCLSHRRRAVQTEYVYQEAQERISRELPAAKRNVVVRVIEQPGLNDPLEHTKTMQTAVLEAEQRVHVDLLADARVVELLYERLGESEGEVYGVAHRGCHRVASFGHYLETRGLALIPGKGKQLIAYENVDLLTLVVPDVYATHARRQHAVSAYDEAVVAIEADRYRHPRKMLFTRVSG